MTNKSNVQVYTEWLEDFEALEPQQAQALICAILRFQSGMDLPEMDAVTQAAWRSIKRQIERDNAAYEEKCETNRRNGLKGGRPRNNPQPQLDEIENRTVLEKTERFLEKPKKPDKDEEEEEDKDKYIAAAESAHARVSEPAAVQSMSENAVIERVMDEWNQIPHAQKVTSILPGQDRYRGLMESVKTHGLHKVVEAIHKIRDSAYLRNRGKPVRMENYIKPEQIPRLLEGYYDREFRDEKKPRRTAFQDFAQRSYDMDALEERLLLRT